MIASYSREHDIVGILRLGDSSKPIFTRLGWSIPYEVGRPEDPKLIEIRTTALLEHRRQPYTVRSVAPYYYNCVGMIFASRRAWIEIDHVERILRDDGYYEIQRNKVVAGDVILYRDYRGDPAHVGIVIEFTNTNDLTSMRVLSKWGKDGEFIHADTDVPPGLGLPSQYFTERKPLELRL